MTVTTNTGTGTGTTSTPGTAAAPPPGTPKNVTKNQAKRPRAPLGHRRLLTRRDRLTLGLMAGVPTILHVMLVWLTALASIALAFTTWDGIGFDSIKWVGLDNFRELLTNNPQFWPAVEHNVVWFVVLILIPTPLGLFLAVQLDKKIRFSKVYQTAFFLPVVLSMAVIGFVWQLVYNPDTGLINNLIGANEPGHYIDWIIEALRAFDLVFVFNKGAQGTELLSILVTNNIIGESSRIGYGSAIAVVLLVISLAVIIPYLIATFRKERRA
ncbi:carbohydrate ABC transporter permease [Streptomyces griseus]|uniref:carbohydrate ABC transporter permease n=1 Tax=Streptomyces griseus TaxID=1911 RepID=UPI00055E8FD2|nr:sugar ABC transporter permease [Streptomyces griseus]